MDVPEFLTDLIQSRQASVEKEASCCGRQYSICLPSGSRISGSGYHDLALHDEYNRVILVLNHVNGIFESPKMESRLGITAPLKIRLNGMLSSSSVLICNEFDAPVLKVKRSMFSSEYPILGTNDVQLGVIKRGWGEYDVEYPADLDVRFKSALLTACIYMDFLQSRRRRRRAGLLLAA